MSEDLYAKLEPHTPEPWKISTGEFPLMDGTDGVYDALESVDGADGSCIVDYHQEYRENSDANARRIVACINACIGLHTEALETGRLEMLFSLIDLAAATPLEQQGSIGRLVLCIASMREHLTALKTTPKPPKKPRVLHPDDELALRIP